MTPTEIKYVEKLKELIEWFGTYGQYVPYVIDLKAEISALEQEMEKERKIIKADDFSQENADDLEWHEIHDEMNESRSIGEIE